MAKKDRNGKRRGREYSKHRVPDLGYYFVVTDTKATEENYLIGLRDSLPGRLQGRIVIKVSKSKTANLVESCKSQAVLEPQFGEPWIVFDRDQVSDFDEIISKAEKEGFGVGWSNPCIEIWFDAYFGQMHGYYDSKQCCLRFAETYERKTGLEYDKADTKIYEILNRYGDEKNAIEIAEKRLQTHISGGAEKPSEMVPATTLHRLIEEIRTKTEIQK